MRLSATAQLLPVAAALTLLPSCVADQRPVKVPRGDTAAVIVGSAALPPPINGVARHPWVALRDAGQHEWERWEVMCCPGSRPLGTVRRSIRSPLSDYGGAGGDVRLHGVIFGKEAERIAACVRERAPHYPHKDNYLVWPGPNSNTVVDWLLRECDIPVDLPAGCIGKDYRGVVGASLTSGGTGVQLETPLIGIKLGATEGIELHLFTFSVGFDWWPPAIIVPVGSGRLGFEDR